MTFRVELDSYLLSTASNYLMSLAVWILQYFLFAGMSGKQYKQALLNCSAFIIKSITPLATAGAYFWQSLKVVSLRIQ